MGGSHERSSPWSPLRQIDFKFGKSSSQRSKTNSGAAQSSPMSMTRLRAFPGSAPKALSRPSHADSRENNSFNIVFSSALLPPTHRSALLRRHFQNKASPDSESLSQERVSLRVQASSSLSPMKPSRSKCRMISCAASSGVSSAVLITTSASLGSS